MKTKKLTSKAGVTIPKDIRAALDLTGGEAIDLIPTGNGDILLRKHAPRCRFCGSIESVGKVKDIDVCPKCARELVEEVHQKYAV